MCVRALSLSLLFPLSLPALCLLPQVTFEDGKLEAGDVDRGLPRAVWQEGGLGGLGFGATDCGEGPALPGPSLKDTARDGPAGASNEQDNIALPPHGLHSQAGHTLARMVTPTLSVPGPTAPRGSWAQRVWA